VPTASSGVEAPAPHCKTASPLFASKERERGRDRARRRRVGKQKFREGEVEAAIYICLIKFKAEAGEAKEEQKKIRRSE